MLAPLFYDDDEMASLRSEIFCFKMSALSYYVFVALCLIVSDNLLKRGVNSSPEFASVSEVKRARIKRAMMSIICRIVTGFAMAPVLYRFDAGDGVAFDMSTCNEGVRNVVVKRCFLISKYCLSVFLLWDLILSHSHFLSKEEMCHHVCILLLFGDVSGLSDADFTSTHSIAVVMLLHLGAGTMMFPVSCLLVYHLCSDTDYLLRVKWLSRARFFHVCFAFPFIVGFPAFFALVWTAQGKFSTMTVVLGAPFILSLAFVEVSVFFQYRSRIRHLVKKNAPTPPSV